MKLLAYVLFLIGIGVGAVLAVMPRIPWSGFAPFIAVALIGVLLIRFETRPKAGSDGETRQGRNLKEQLAAIFQRATRLINEGDWSDRSGVKKEIEEIEALVADVVEGRGEAIARFGYGGFSRIFVPLAQGERNLHRAWSALVDGNVEEARNVLEESAATFKQAWLHAREAME
ncbi:MAG: hypothetical protein JRJ48_01940 [Deltaproteobacteria bacterium]|nr:hypothetical protein [Deltaproteobacteria bacterium]